MLFRQVSIAVLLLPLAGSPALAFEFPHIIQQDDVKLELMPRSPEQIASFYEARGFPQEMIDVLRQQCFITVRIHNRRDELLWLELENWDLSNAGKPIQRAHRDEWKRRWQQMKMPLPAQSTFRWTLLPEVLDYLPDEQESGNIIIPRVHGNIRLSAEFATGEDRSGRRIRFDYDRLSCVDE
jgi:hypothetical protein